VPSCSAAAASSVSGSGEPDSGLEGAALVLADGPTDAWSEAVSAVLPQADATITATRSRAGMPRPVRSMGKPDLQVRDVGLDAARTAARPLASTAS
jgi:hypothetical protein